MNAVERSVLNLTSGNTPSTTLNTGLLISNGSNHVSELINNLSEQRVPEFCNNTIPLYGKPSEQLLVIEAIQQRTNSDSKAYKTLNQIADMIKKLPATENSAEKKRLEGLIRKWNDRAVDSKLMEKLDSITDTISAGQPKRRRKRSEPIGQESAEDCNPYSQKWRTFENTVGKAMCLDITNPRYIVNVFASKFQMLGDGGQFNLDEALLFFNLINTGRMPIKTREKLLGMLVKMTSSFPFFNQTALNRKMDGQRRFLALLEQISENDRMDEFSFGAFRRLAKKVKRTDLFCVGSYEDTAIETLRINIEKLLKAYGEVQSKSKAVDKMRQTLLTAFPVNEAIKLSGVMQLIENSLNKSSYSQIKPELLAVIKLLTGMLEKAEREFSGELTDDSLSYYPRFFLDKDSLDIVNRVKQFLNQNKGYSEFGSVWERLRKKYNGFDFLTD